MGKFVKKPVIIEALQWTGDNSLDVAEFCQDSERRYEFKGDALFIHTLEGSMRASINDYIIKGVNGEFYPCKPDIFEKTYEKVEEPAPTDTFESLSRPLMKWLTETYDPHHRVIISSEVAVVTQDIKGFQTEDYIVD